MQRNQHVRFGGGRLETQVRLCAGCLPYFLLFSTDKRQLWEWRAALIHKLAELRLTLHEESAQVYPCSTGIPFLGFRLYPDHRLVKRRKVVAYRCKLRSLLVKASQDPEGRLKLDASLQGWINHVRYGDSWGLRRSMLNFVVPRV